MHWEKVYASKQPNEVSWTQQTPQTSLDFIHRFNLSKEARIIDIGGGDSKLVDHLLSEGYENITVLDISAKAIDKAKQRLSERAADVTWIISDVIDFEPRLSYDVWHDRATFHFLTKDEEVKKYAAVVERAVSGYLMIATFSDTGPEKCSGLTVKRYNEIQLAEEFAKSFEKIHCLQEDHVTPFHTRQNFLFCGFKKLNRNTNH